MEYNVSPGNMKLGRRIKQSTQRRRQPVPPEPFITHAPRLLDKLLRDDGKDKIESLWVVYGNVDSRHAEIRSLTQGTVDVIKSGIEKGLTTSLEAKVAFRGPPRVEKIYNLHV